ncbi:MAG: glycosyltransferase family 4 protein [Candidatus Thermoplasmatota archaeon]
MKIKYLFFGVGRTGGTRVIFEFANHLIMRGHEVTITAIREKHDWFPLKANVEYVPTIFRNIQSSNSNVFDLFRDVNDIISLAKGLKKSDIVVATWCFTAFSTYFAKKFPDEKIFYHMQHYEPLFFKNPFYKFFSGLTYRLNLKLIANSTWLKNKIMVKYGKSAYLLNPAIDHTTFKPNEIKKTVFDKKIKEKKKVLCLGKTLFWKGLGDVFEAMKIVNKKMDNVHLVLYGSEKDIKSPVPYTYVFKPTDEELADLYRACDTYICPSWYESFPLPPLEAMACGTPVVTTRCGTEDYAIHNENALVVMPRSINEIAEAIIKVLTDEDLQEKLRKNGIETAKKFTWDRAVDNLEKIFLEALEERG